MWHKGIKYQTECVTNMKFFLKVINNKAVFSECENEYLIECQTKVKLNVWQMWTWVFNNKETNIKLNVSECITNMKFFPNMIKNKPKAFVCRNECQTKVKLNVLLLWVWVFDKKELDINLTWMCNKFEILAENYWQKKLNLVNMKRDV